MLFCNYFRILELISKSLIHFEIILCKSSFISLHVNSMSPAPFARDTVSPPVYIVGTFTYPQVTAHSACVCWLLGPLFCFMYGFCASATHSLWLWFCSIIWDWVLWYLQHCSFLPRIDKQIFLVCFVLSLWFSGFFKLLLVLSWFTLMVTGGF